MKKVRTVINVVLGSMVAALGLNSCEHHDEEVLPLYGIPYEEIDTTAQCKYGVNPNPIINWDDETND